MVGLRVILTCLKYENKLVKYSYPWLNSCTIVSYSRMTQAGTYYNQMAVRPEATVRPVVINWHAINHLPSNLDVHLYVRCVYTCLNHIYPDLTPK